MGVKGLQYFMETCYPETCLHVDLGQLAAAYAKAHPDVMPSVVVDGMACLRYWYQCEAWVHGGQWQEYMHFLHQFVEAFRMTGLRLVFFFDSTVAEQKRAEWVKRRLRVNQDIARIFDYIRNHHQQPDGKLFCLPSGLASFSAFAFKFLGQETYCSVHEGDYEIAEYALHNNCIGILGQDTDFVIYDTVPYLSIAKLKLGNMTTVQYSREKLCSILKLQKADLPFLACILGNDIVPEHQLQNLRKDALTSYGKKQPGEKVHAAAEFINAHREISMLHLSEVDAELVDRGIRSYLLPGQTSPWLKQSQPLPEQRCVMEKHINKVILQAAKGKQTQAEGFMIYNVLHYGVVECSNTLEDEEIGLPPQAILYQPLREHIYGVLLPRSHGENLSVQEWFVFPGNPLKEAKQVFPKALNTTEGTPDLTTLWFGNDSEVKRIRVSTFLAVFDLQDFSEDLKSFDTPLVAVICLVTYIANQAKHVSVEDIDAYLSQAVCIRYKSHADLRQTKVPQVDPRAVHLGSLLVRGLTYLIAANTACGFPFAMNELMPWKMFDGLLFHSKYLQAHSGCAKEELLEGEPSWVSLFLTLRDLVLKACRRNGCSVHSFPCRLEHGRPVYGESHRECEPQFFSTHDCYHRQRPRGPFYMQGRGYRPRSSVRQSGRRYHLAPRWPR